MHDIVLILECNANRYRSGIISAALSAMTENPVDSI
jgi:hypothetical protein